MMHRRQQWQVRFANLFFVHDTVWFCYSLREVCLRWCLARPWRGWSHDDQVRGASRRGEEASQNHLLLALITTLAWLQTSREQVGIRKYSLSIYIYIHSLFDVELNSTFLQICFVLSRMVCVHCASAKGGNAWRWHRRLDDLQQWDCSTPRRSRSSGPEWKTARASPIAVTAPFRQTPEAAPWPERWNPQFDEAMGRWSKHTGARCFSHVFLVVSVSQVRLQAHVTRPFGQPWILWGTTSGAEKKHEDGETSNEKGANPSLDSKVMEYLEQHFKDIDLHFKALEAKSGSTFPQVQFAAEIDPEPLPHEAEAEGRSNKLKRLKKVVKAKKVAQTQSETESFELCKALGRNRVKRSNASSNANTLLKMKDLTTCDATEQVAVFEPDEGSYNIACCAKDSLHCSGCMKLNGDSCDLCSGGFSDSSGTCEACLDLPGWETIDGVNCYDLTVASCDDVKVRGHGVRGFLCWSILYLRPSKMFGHEFFVLSAMFTWAKCLHFGSSELVIDRSERKIHFAFNLHLFSEPCLAANQLREGNWQGGQGGGDRHCIWLQVAFDSWECDWLRRTRSRRMPMTFLALLKHLKAEAISALLAPTTSVDSLPETGGEVFQDEEAKDREQCSRWLRDRILGLDFWSSHDWEIEFSKKSQIEFYFHRWNIPKIKKHVFDLLLF